MVLEYTNMGVLIQNKRKYRRDARYSPIIGIRPLLGSLGYRIIIAIRRPDNGW